jgi:hypothetical protein
MAQPTIEIRQAFSNDVETIAGFNIALCRETEGRELDPATVSEGVRRFVSEPARGRYYVALIDGDVVGQTAHTFEWSDWRNHNVSFSHMSLTTSISRGRLLAAISAAFLLLPISPLFAQGQAPPAIELGLPFRDNAILQREMPVPVWGWSKPGTTVTVEFAGQKESATAGADGKWMLKLKPLKASAEPAEMVVQESGNKVVLKNILVGEVWHASGQSNMEWFANKSMCVALGEGDREIPQPKCRSANCEPTPCPPSIRRKGAPRRRAGNPAAWPTVSPPWPFPLPTNSTRS